MQITIPEVQQFMIAVADMRKAQRDYFSMRTSVMLQRARAAELRVDELLAKHSQTASPSAPQPKQQDLWG